MTQQQRYVDQKYVYIATPLAARRCRLEKVAVSISPCHGIAEHLT